MTRAGRAQSLVTTNGMAPPRCSLCSTASMGGDRIVHGQHRHEESLKFMHTVDREVAKGIAFHMILDNCATHTD
jgi:hypothetical protein